MSIMVLGGVCAIRLSIESVDRGQTLPTVTIWRSRLDRWQALVGDGEAGDGWVVRGEVGVEALARGAAWHAVGHLLPEVIAVRAVRSLV